MPLTGKEMLKLLKKNGWKVKRITVPVHSNKDLKKDWNREY